jgi:hypothetical protein
MEKRHLAPNPNNVIPPPILHLSTPNPQKPRYHQPIPSTPILHSPSAAPRAEPLPSRPTNTRRTQKPSPHPIPLRRNKPTVLFATSATTQEKRNKRPQASNDDAKLRKLGQRPGLLFSWSARLILACPTLFRHVVALQLTKCGEGPILLGVHVTSCSCLRSTAVCIGGFWCSGKGCVEEGCEGVVGCLIWG